MTEQDADAAIRSLTAYDQQIYYSIAFAGRECARYILGPSASRKLGVKRAMVAPVLARLQRSGLVSVFWHGSTADVTINHIDDIVLFHGKKRINNLRDVHKYEDAHRAPLQLVKHSGSRLARCEPPIDDEIQRVEKILCVGEVAAGYRLPSDTEFVPELIEIRSQALPRDCFAVRVRGTSMTGAGIEDGHVVIARPISDARHGDYVIANILIDDTWYRTLKMFVVENGKIHLRSVCAEPQDENFDDLQLIGEAVRWDFETAL